MKLSTKGRYGLRALVDLAIHSQEGPVPLQSIACRQKISQRYLEQLMGSLKKAGLVTSTRGVQGGYQLARDAAEISVGDVLRALEGDLRAVDCPAETGQEGCEIAGACVTRYVWKRVNESIRQTVDTIWISQLAREGKEKQNRLMSIRDPEMEDAAAKKQDPERTCEG